METWLRNETFRWNNGALYEKNQDEEQKYLSWREGYIYILWILFLNDSEVEMNVYIWRLQWKNQEKPNVFAYLGQCKKLKKVAVVGFC